MVENPQLGRMPADWERLFLLAGVRVEELTATKNSRGKAVKIGQFFSPLVNREVAIQVKGRTGIAVLRAVNGRAKEKRYYIEVRWDREAGATELRDVPCKRSPAHSKKLPRSNPPPKAAGKKGNRKVTVKPERTAGSSTHADTPANETKKNGRPGNNMQW